jgi:ABC-type branched-subunit amino acid transport system substrate-binding protein
MMLKNWTIILLLMTTVNCIAHENSIRTKPERDFREESFERARALYQIKESRAALKTLDKIINLRPFDALTVDAVLFAVDIHMAERNPENAIEVLRVFEEKLRGIDFDRTRLVRAKERVARVLAPPVEKGRREALTQAAPKLSEPVTTFSPRTVSKSIGVLLPLSGPYEIYGKRALAAMQLAFNANTERRENGALALRNANGLTLVVMDTKGNAQIAREAMDRLVDEFHVSVVVGDLLAETALAIAQKAKERDVINLTLSKKEGLTAIGPQIFRLAMTPKKQVKALISVPGNVQEKKRYAILYPENAFGTEMRDAFAAQVKGQGSVVVKMQSYKPDETTFTTTIRSLVGAKKTAGNPKFEECSERAGHVKDTAARKKAERDCADAVAPKVAFDALFIPEFPKTLTYIVPALISEGVMVSQNEEMVRAYRRTTRMTDAVPVQLLGPNSWNSATVGEKLGSQVEGAVFVDSGDLEDPRILVKSFVESFTAASQSAPALSEAYAYDAIRIMQQVFAAADQSPSLDLSTIKTALQGLDGEGVLGKISFDKDRELVTPFRLFCFQDGKVVPKT